MAKDLAIVLNNGSLNSAVMTAMANQRHRTIMMFAESADQSGARARAAFDQQVGHFKPYREYIVPLPIPGAMKSKTPAAIADPRQSEPLAPQMLDLLPLLAIATRYAVHHQASVIYVGMRVGPDPDELAKATEYFQIWSELIQLPCGQEDLTIETPLLEMEAWQVVDTGFNVQAPFDRTWSCQEESSEPCWACRGCRNREAAFQQAAKSDPLRAVRKV